MILSNNASVGYIYTLNLVGDAFTPGTPPLSATNVPPIASNYEFNVLANSANNVLYPLVNDIDSNGLPMQIISITTPGNGGTATIINNGTAVSYTPPVGIRSYPDTPADGFYYTISDASGLTATGTIYIIVNASDQPQVSIISPPNNYTTNAGAIVPIVASATLSQNISPRLSTNG